ncbi:hypothetical protein HK098_007546 [Nowakowskiella sp. JEL0407]|nr:hypothetical protein HK098_007546 [Nowakowskiella sp. JEL0407]
MSKPTDPRKSSQPSFPTNQPPAYTPNTYQSPQNDISNIQAQLALLTQQQLPPDQITLLTQFVSQAAQQQQMAQQPQLQLNPLDPQTQVLLAFLTNQTALTTAQSSVPPTATPNIAFNNTNNEIRHIPQQLSSQILPQSLQTQEPQNFEIEKTTTVGKSSLPSTERKSPPQPRKFSGTVSENATFPERKFSEISNAVLVVESEEESIKLLESLKPVGGIGLRVSGTNSFEITDSISKLIENGDQYLRKRKHSEINSDTTGKSDESISSAALKAAETSSGSYVVLPSKKNPLIPVLPRFIQ